MNLELMKLELPHNMNKRLEFFYILNIVLASLCGTLGGVWSLFFGIRYHEVVTIVGSAIGCTIGIAFTIAWACYLIKKVKEDK